MPNQCKYLISYAILVYTRCSQAAERRSNSAPELSAMCETPSSVTSNSVTVAPFQGLTDIETGHTSTTDTADTDNSSESDSAVAALLANSSGSSSSTA
jgi:hypothetical protein